MDGQTSCPVCKLYLLSGMKLDEHLETHPKDQVIKALVTLYGQPPARPQASSTPCNALTGLAPFTSTHQQQPHQSMAPSSGTIFLNTSNGNYHQQSPKFILIPQSKAAQLALPPPPLRLNNNNTTSTSNINTNFQQTIHHQPTPHYQTHQLSNAPPPTAQITIPSLTTAGAQLPIVAAQSLAADVVGNQQTIQYLQETDKNVMIVNSCSTQYIQQTTIPNNNDSPVTPATASIFPRYTNERYSGPPPPYSAAISTITQTQNHTVRSRLQQQTATSLVRQSSPKQAPNQLFHPQGGASTTQPEEGEIVLHEFVVSSIDGQYIEENQAYNVSGERIESNLTNQDMDIDSVSYEERFTDPVEYQMRTHVDEVVEQRTDAAQREKMSVKGPENGLPMEDCLAYVAPKLDEKANDSNVSVDELIFQSPTVKSGAKQGLKVLSNIKVTEDILSEGLKDIIIRANSKTSGSTDDIFIQSGSCKFPMPLIERIIKVEAKTTSQMDQDEVSMLPTAPAVEPPVVIDLENESDPVVVELKDETPTSEPSIEDLPVINIDDLEEEKNCSVTSATTSVIRMVPTVTVPTLPASPVPSTSQEPEQAPPAVASTSSQPLAEAQPAPLYLRTITPATKRPVFNKPPKKLFVKFKNPPPTMVETMEPPKIKQELPDESEVAINQGSVHFQDSNMESIEETTNLESIITLSPESTKTEIESDDEQLLEHEPADKTVCVKQEPIAGSEMDKPIDVEENVKPEPSTEEIFKEIQENYPSFSKDILNDPNFAQDFLKKVATTDDEDDENVDGVKHEIEIEIEGIIGNEEEVVDDADNVDTDDEVHPQHHHQHQHHNHSMDVEEDAESALLMAHRSVSPVDDDDHDEDSKLSRSYILPDHQFISKREKSPVHDDADEEDSKLSLAIHQSPPQEHLSIDTKTALTSIEFDLNEAGPSARCTTTSTSVGRETFALSNFLSYANTDPDTDHYNYTNDRARFSPMVYNPTSEENIPFQWCQSPQYPPFDERSSYVDLDLCSKTNSNSVSVSATTTTTTQHTIDNNSANTSVTANDRAPSAHSLNIRTDEKMPAKGELSEQESNGEMDQWNQIYPLSENTLPHYPSSYEMSTAQECWNLNTKCTTVTSANHLQPNGHSLIVSNFQLINPNADHHILHPHDHATHMSLTSGLQEIIPKQEHGTPSATATSSSSDTKKLLADKIKARKYRCTECAQVFPLLKLRREHMIQDHGHNHPLEIESRLLCSAKIKTESGLLSSAVASSSTSAVGITQDIFSDLANTQRFIIKQIKDATTTELEEHSSVTKYKTKINRILMDYNLLNHELQMNAADPTVTQESKLDSLRRQLNGLGKSTQYTCITCRAEFPTLRMFDQHMNVHPGECYTCGRTFKHWSNFALHIKRHLGIRNYVCRACHKGFVVRQKLIEHLRTHTGHAPIKCNLCNERFRRYSNLVQHRNRHHLNKRPPKADFVCHCGEVFNSKAKVEWHAEIHDTKPKNCPHCRERFIHRNSLTRHIRLSHPEKYDFVKKDTHQCPVCLKKFVASSIKTHLETHSASKKLYSCNICNKNFSTKWNLKQHQYTHANRSSKPFLCNLCPNAFIRETDFITHMNAHRSIRPYTCNFCGRQFVRKYNWLRHTREHEKEKKFSCPTCGKKFHRQYYLTEHKRVHSGERPFSCNICGKTSATKTNHNKHVKIHHARDPLTAEG